MNPLKAKELYELSTNHSYAAEKLVDKAHKEIGELRGDPRLTNAGYDTQLAGFVYYIYAWGDEMQFRLFCEHAGNHVYLSQIEIYKYVWKENIGGIQEFMRNL